MIRIVEYLKKMISPTIVYVYTKVAMDLLVDTFSNIPHRLDLRTRVFLGGGGSGQDTILNIMFLVAMLIQQRKDSHIYGNVHHG